MTITATIDQHVECMSTNYQKQLSTDQDDDQGRYVQEYTLMRCILLIISITKCPHSKKSHQNIHTGNNVKYEVIWKWQLVVMLLIYKEHASHLHSVLDKSGLRVSIDTQLWMPFIFVPAFKSPNIILEKLQASWNRSIYLSGLFFFLKWPSPPMKQMSFHDKHILPCIHY